jgi:hypothetical protein
VLLMEKQNIVTGLIEALGVFIREDPPYVGFLDSELEELWSMLKEEYPAYFAAIDSLSKALRKLNVKYERNLSSCINDVNDVVSFVHETLGVPHRRIWTLTDESATFSNILERLRLLSEEPDITRDDPILIYYAGLIIQSRYDSNSPEVTELVPYDADCRLPEASFKGISSQKFNYMLSKISHSKGNNIVRFLYNAPHA